jgi:hypothetical protein
MGMLQQTRDVTDITRRLFCLLLAVVPGCAQVDARCRPHEVLAPGRRASDSVVIGSRTVPRTELAVRDAWKALGRTPPPRGMSFLPGERVLVFRDSQPDGTAVFDGCRLVAEQLPLPSHATPDSITSIEVWPNATVAHFQHDRRGYQAVLFTINKNPRR